jgi:rod shape-determining protein MreC
MRLSLGLAILILIGTIFFTIIFQLFPFIKTINTGISFVSNPVNHYLYRGINYLSNVFFFFLTSQEKVKEIEKLRQEVRLLNSQLASCQMLISENDTLRQQLHFIEESKFPFSVAKVIGRVNQDGQTLLLLDKGKKNGVEVGLPVIVDKGIIVGKILKVEENKSFLLPSFANQSRLAATFVNQPSTTGLVRGEHNLSLKMEFIPRDVTINQGEIVITSGLEPLIPRGLVIGKIEEVATVSGDLFQSAYLQSLYSLNDLQIVTILLPYEK